ncbi:MAG: hypothetical protein Kow0099_32590 [Candidatus Abyssubacteria bacterium]
MNVGSRTAVLIVDDEDRFRVTTTASLKRRGFEVKAVGSGLEAIEEISKTDFDVVILDIKMPYMDGHETMRRLKRLRPDIEVIMLTGYGALDSALAGRSEGVFAYLTKPCSIDFLAMRIREACCKRQGAAEYTRRAKDIMVPLSAFMTAINENQTVAEVVEAILRHMDKNTSGAALHCSFLITDEGDEVVSVICFSDLLRALRHVPAELSESQPPTADSIYMDPPGYLGGFITAVRELAPKTVGELALAKPPIVAADADLTEVLDQLTSTTARNLLVQEEGKIVGVIREKDLFLEMATILRSSGESRFSSMTSLSDDRN